MKTKKLYPKYDPGTYHSRELYRIVTETRDLRPVWAHRNANKWGVDYEQFLALCKEECSCCGSPLDYGLGKNNVEKLDVNTPSTDHIIPRSLGGKDDISNFWIICVRCNLFKSSATSEDIHRMISITKALEKIGLNIDTL